MHCDCCVALNTILRRSGKLKLYLLLILLNKMYKDISLNVQLFHHDIVIEPNICFGRSKICLTETALLSTHNTCIRHALFSGGLAKHMDLFWGHFRVSHNYNCIFIFGRLSLLLTQTSLF